MSSDSNEDNEVSNDDMVGDPASVQEEFMDSINLDVHEKTIVHSLNNIMENESSVYEIAPLNRDTGDWSESHRNEFLVALIKYSPVQSMLCKNTGKRNLRSATRYVLFNGCHRVRAVRGFLNGEYPIDVPFPHGNINLWISEDALVGDPQTNAVILPALLGRIRGTGVAMTQLPSTMSDADAYERARMENDCVKLTDSQIMKISIAKNTPVAKLMQDCCLMSGPVKACANHFKRPPSRLLILPLSLRICHTFPFPQEYLGDDVYKYIASAIFYFLGYGFENKITEISVKKLPGILDMIKEDEQDKFNALKKDMLLAVKKSVNMLGPAMCSVALSDKVHYRVGCVYLGLILAAGNKKQKNVKTAAVQACLKKVIENKMSGYHQYAYNMFMG